MDTHFESAVDRLGMKILRELQANARATFSEIGRSVGLSSPAVADRVHKMEESGIINGYHADINPTTLGHHIVVFMTLTTQPEKYSQFYAFAEEVNEIVECHHISGAESFVLKLVLGSISHLESMVEKVSKFGQTKTSVVLSSPIKKKIMTCI